MKGNFQLRRWVGGGVPNSFQWGRFVSRAGKPELEKRVNGKMKDGQHAHEEGKCGETVPRYQRARQCEANIARCTKRCTNQISWLVFNSSITRGLGAITLSVSYTSPNEPVLYQPFLCAIDDDWREHKP